MLSFVRCWLYVVFLGLMLLLICACVLTQPQVHLISGETMGTTYSVKYVADNQIDQTAIDDLLVDINQSLSTYIPESTISKINQATFEQCSKISLNEFFIDNFEMSQTIYETTEGYFNPALMPLVNYWGFGYGKKNKGMMVDTNEVHRLLSLGNFNDFQFHQTHLTKKNTAQQLDFSAIAKGYGVDQIALLLNARNINNYLIEIGGELRAKGKNTQKEYWRVGVDKPQKGINQRTLKAILPLKNQSIATSGNYRNYRKLGDLEYGHIINPKTGFPEQKQIISATIIAETCALADAYATACMVMGFEKAKQMVEQNADLNAYFIYKNKEGKIETYQSNGLEIIEMK